MAFGKKVARLSARPSTPRLSTKKDGPTTNTKTNSPMKKTVLISESRRIPLNSPVIELITNVTTTAISATAHMNSPACQPVR